MEALTRLVTDSLVRHGIDRPLDPRRLQWSDWFRCDSTHSLLVVPSKPGIFALAEEILDLGPDRSAAPDTDREEHDFNRPVSGNKSSAASAAKRMLAVLQFSEDDDMAFTLDRMFTRINPMRARLASGNCFLRFVVLEDEDQRRGICTLLNQWIRSSAEKVTGLPAAFSSSLELTSESVARAHSPAKAYAPANGMGTTSVLPQDDNRHVAASAAEAGRATVEERRLNAVEGQRLNAVEGQRLNAVEGQRFRAVEERRFSAASRDTAEQPFRACAIVSPHLNSGPGSNLHCPQPFPSGF